MMEHIIYKITNTLNNRFYIGMHSTENVNDGYLGSGRRIKAEVRKYGKEHFVKEILERLPSREMLKTREAEIVCEELRNNPLCLNLKNGGEGGFTSEQCAKIWSDSNRRKKQGERISNCWKDPEYRSNCSKASSLTMKESHAKGKMRYDTFLGKMHKAETKAKVGAKNSMHQTGEGNSQFGTCWVTDGVKPVKVKKEHLDEFLAKGFKRGRKIN
ncbi:GIY-YIG nuclease family protein [Acinetobacter sp.]|uniref:GIY-YIG nuclease family protein n=1 Tax=Acinetobacter sp. TaxID=472 RepID=UPI00388E4B2F